MNSKMKITITKNEAYMVSGNVPLYKKSLVVENGLLTLKNEGRIDTPANQDYYLCRCGHSKNPPFCDGAHQTKQFDGIETADMRPYIERAKLLKGNSIDLLDDYRCAFARLCHRHQGDVWELTENSHNPENKEEAIKGASQCITGRLVAISKDGKLIEDTLEPSISIIQDPLKNVSGGIYVTGGITLESADGKQYETRNRFTLCRCGQSDDTPFCDANHVGSKFNDGS